MDIKKLCRICDRESQSSEFVKVSGTTKDVENEIFTVWRCCHCATLNALEPVDYERIYKNYPIQRQCYDSFAKWMFAKRLNVLVGLGLRPNHLVLDYGCGSGHFIKFLKEKGYSCSGYDPYSANHSDTAVLKGHYDFVVCQDVLEHVDQPKELLRQLTQYVVPSGKLVIGTPYADHANIYETLDQLGVLHQPFHRFVISKQQISSFFTLPGWKLQKVLFACYIDTAYPFANTMFLFHLFKSGKGLMDFAFDPIPLMHFIRHPSLLFWGFFGRLFARSQDFFVVMVRE